MKKLFVFLAIFSFAVLPQIEQFQILAQTSVTVNPKLGPVKCKDNADDPAIWIHPTNKSKSLMFLSDKDAGFCVFDFNGTQIQYFPLTTSLNNIDVRYGFNFGGRQIDIMAANLRATAKLGVWEINPNWTSGNAVTMLSGPSSTGNGISADSYGFTLYKRLSDGKMYAFDKSKSSAPIQQWLVDGSTGSIKTTLVRTINDVSIAVAEGFVADDELGFVYFGEEVKMIIHKYNADPNHPVKTRLSVFGSGVGFAPELEGISLYKCNDGTGYLLASSQGNSTFKVFERQGANAFKKTFIANRSSGTDGLDSISASLSPNYPGGFVIIHDDPSMTYHVYSWNDIAGSDLKICPDGGTSGPVPTTAAGPRITITSPTTNQTVQGTTVTVRYSQSGDLSQVDHVHLQLDSQPEVRDLDNDGTYVFSNVAPGTHTVLVYQGKADHSQFPNSDSKATVTFTVAPGGSITADIISNGCVDIFDFNALVANFGKTGSNIADIDNDGDVDIFDFNRVVSEFGRCG